MMRIASSTFYQQAVSSIDQNETQLSTVQEQMGSGLQFQTASQNPVAAGQVLGVNQSIADVANWQSNATSLGNSLGLENSTLTSVNTALQQIQTLALQANSGTVSSSDRQQIAQEMQQQYNSIVQLANTQDSSGNYIFGGTQSGSAPFTQTAGGANYNGNSIVDMLSLGPTSEIAAADPGDAVFMQVAPGSGTVDVSAASGNTGTGSVTAATISSPGQYNSGSYTVQFSGSQYQVLDSGNNLVGSGTYTAGNAIQFAGVSLTLSGTPASGDSFSVSPAQKQSLFGSIQSLINVVANPGSGGAQQAHNQTALYGGLQSLSAAQTQITNVLAGVGARQQAVTTATSQLQSRATQLQSTLTGLQDLDYAQATAQFSQYQTTLQAAEQSYVQIQGLSLFNYIK
jgi:flagellar hook-associated protein 3 FlgL